MVILFAVLRIKTVYKVLKVRKEKMIREEKKKKDID